MKQASRQPGRLQNALDSGATPHVTRFPRQGALANLGQSCRLIGAVLLVASSFTLASFSALTTNAAAQSADERSDTLIIARSGPVNTLDPLRADYAQTNFIDSVLYDTLVTFDESGQLVGSLAEEFTVAEDVKSVNMTLRSDVKFHDGAPVTAADVAYTLDRLKRLGAGIAAQIEGYDTTVVNSDTDLTITLTKPFSLFLSGLSKVYILNSALVAANAGSDDGQAWLQSNDAGSGPYTLVDQRGNAFTVRLFDGYWSKVEGRPRTIVFRRIDESATAQAELRAGNVDLVIGMSDRDAAAIAEDTEISVVKLEAPIQSDIVFNTRTGPTADRRVRRAIQLAFDYEGALAGIRSGNGALADGPLPNTLSCRPDLPSAKRDLEEAKRLLAEAGAENLHLTMKFQPVFEAQAREATLLQSNLREIGVTLDLEPIAFPDWLASLKDLDSIPQMMLFEDFAQVPDPGVTLVKGFSSDAIGTNRAGYSNPEVDALLQEALVTSDEGRRCEIYQQVQTIVDEDVVMVDMYTLTKPIVYRTGKLEGVTASQAVYPIAPADLRNIALQ